MEDLVKKAKNYFILARIAERVGMISESASNYFKAVSAVNDFMLEKKGLKAKDHSDRFSLLKQNIPELYKITDRMFTIYRRTYTSEITEIEIKALKKDVEEIFKNASLSIPSDREVEEEIKKISKE